MGPGSGCEAATGQAWKGGPREKWKWRTRTLRFLQVTRRALSLSFPHVRPTFPRPPRARTLSLRSPRRRDGGRGGQTVGNPPGPRLRTACQQCFRFSISSQSSSFSAPAEFPESTWCGSSQQPPPSRRSLLSARPQRPQWREQTHAARGGLKQSLARMLFLKDSRALKKGCACDPTL